MKIVIIIVLSSIGLGALLFFTSCKMIGKKNPEKLRADLYQAISLFTRPPEDDGGSFTLLEIIRVDTVTVEEAQTLIKAIESARDLILPNITDLPAKIEGQIAALAENENHLKNETFEALKPQWREVVEATRLNIENLKKTLEESISMRDDYERKISRYRESIQNQQAQIAFFLAKVTYKDRDENGETWFSVSPQMKVYAQEKDIPLQ